MLAATTLNGIASGYLLADGQPEQIGIATDVYYHAARALLAGEAVYGVTPPDHPGFYFIYPPIVLLAVAPAGLLGSALAVYAVQTAVNLLAGLGLGRLLVVAVERGRAADGGGGESAGPALSRRSRLVLHAFALGSFSAASTVVMGQVNLLLALGVATGALLVEPVRGQREPGRTGRIGERIRDHREVAAGVLFAAVATVKLFPALFGAWFVGRRAWRALGAAVVAGVAGIVAGAAVFGPDLTVTYVTESLARELDIATFADGPEPDSPYLTVRRQLAFLFPELSSAWLLPVSFAVVAPVVAGCYRSLATTRDRLVALHATMLGTLICFPLEPFYLALTIFPMAALCHLLPTGHPRRCYLFGTLVVSVPVRYPAVEGYVQALPVGAGLEAQLLDATAVAFGFALPTMYGVWALLVGMLWYQHRRDSGAYGPE